MSELPFALPDITEHEIRAVTECLGSGWLTSGPKVRAFEQAFATYVGAAHAISCNSATAGSLLLMEAIGIGPGDEVVVPVWTFSGPAMMAHKLGAGVVFADVDPNSFNLTVETLERVITPRTRLVMPTHFAGRSCDMTALLSFCRQRKLLLIDDAAHAFPTTDDTGGFVGHQGSAATFFSFYATKTLTTGEGGMIATDDAELAQRVRSRRTHGINRDIFERSATPVASWRYDVAQPGWKANLTDIAASLGLVQLERSAGMLERRTAIARRYDASFCGYEDQLRCPAVKPGHAWHLYPLRVLAGGRDRFIEAMRRHGVQCSMHFIPLHQHSFWAETGVNARSSFPHADRVSAEEVSLPIYSSMSSDAVDQVIRAASLSLAECRDELCVA